MKHSIKMLLGMIICMICSFHVQGQQYPVQVTPVITPPYSLYLSDYTAPEGNLQLIIQLRELDRSQYKIKLRLHIEGQGITIQTKASYNPQAIVLQGGVTEMLTGADIKNYFNPDNLDFSGIAKQEFVKKGALPEGFYTFKFEAVDFVRNVVVSNSGFANAWLILNDPPIINLPFNNDKVVATDPQNVMFSWTPRHTASPNAAFTTEYEFTMVEMPDNHNPNDAIRVGRPIFVTQTSATSLNYGITETLLTPGRKYAFRVQAYDTDGKDLFKNNGYSEVFVFQFGDRCLQPTAVTATALDDARFKLTWDPLDVHTAFGIQYRKKGNKDWNEQNALSNSAIIPGLEPNTAYEYQVKGVCGTIQGEYSALASVTTLRNDPAEFSCGVPPPAIELKTTPLSDPLKIGDLIKTADFEIRVTEVDRNPDNSYKGKGKALIPWFKFAAVLVKFHDIKVNEDYRVFSGNVTTIYLKSSRSVGNFDLAKDKDDDEQNSGNGSSGAGNKDEVKFDTITIAADIKTISVNLDSNPGVIVVVAEDGTTQEIPREKDADGKFVDTVVKDSKGDSWIVSKDGQVTAGPSSAAPDAVASLDAVKYTVKFAAVPGQDFGFDTKEIDAKLGTYQNATIHDKPYDVPWKSVETGRQDRVAAIAGSESTFPVAVGFKSDGGAVPSQPSSNAAQKEIIVHGKVSGGEETITAYATVKESENAEAKEVELGKLNVATYDKIKRHVVIVPVNDDTNLTEPVIEDALNTIYKQAVVEWDVDIAPKFLYEANDLVGLDAEESDEFSAFPNKMQVFNQTFRNTTWVDKDTYYLFLVKGTGSTRTGFMPLGRDFGYIFIDNLSDDTQTWNVAHELAHGAFNLRHTFSAKAKYANRGETKNLLDYGNGTNLKKYQWDLIRKPEEVNAWQESDEESASEIKYFNITVSSVLNLQELGFTDNVNYVCPDGTLVTLPVSAVVSFTGVTHNVELDKAVSKGTLLGFKTEGKTYVSQYRLVDNKWAFTGYTLVGANGYNPGIAGIATSKTVLIGREGENCQLELVTGKISAIPYIEKKNILIKEGVLSLTGEVPVKIITIPDCDQIYQTQSARYFLAEAKRVHGEAQLNELKEIAGTIDKLGDNWFADFQSANQEPRFPSPNIRYVNVLSSYAKPEDITAFLKMIKAYEANKKTNFNKIVEMTVQNDLLDLLKGFTINDYKNLTVAQRKHILNVLATGELGGTYFHEHGEGFALKVISTTEKPGDATEMLTHMETTTVGGSVLAVRLMDLIDDGIIGSIGGDNYKLLMTEYSALVTRSSKFADKVKDLLETNFNARLIKWQIRTDQSVGVITSSYSLSEQGSITISRSQIVSTQYVSFEGGFYIPTYKELDPITLGAFDLIAFVNLGNLDIISEAAGTTSGEMAIVPAIFLKYAKKKNFNDNAMTVASITLDAVTIVTTAGTLTVAKNLSRLRKAWLLFEISNSTLNIAINISGLANDPEWKPVIDNYNMVTCLLSIGELTYSGAKNADAILYKVSTAAEASADAIKVAGQKFYNALKSIDPAKLSGDARKAYDKLLEFAQKLKTKYGLVDDILAVTLSKLKASVATKIASNVAYALTWTDAELTKFIELGKSLKLADDDIEAFILAHCRRSSKASFDDMSKVMQSIVSKSAANSIGFKPPYNMLSAYKAAQNEMALGKALDPRVYLSDAYISSHLENFHGKASYFVNGSTYERRIKNAPTVGVPSEVSGGNSLYISTGKAADEAVLQAGKDLGKYEELLGFSKGDFSNDGQVWRIDIVSPENFGLRMPSGFEAGANHWWHPGGFTSGGTIEAVTDVVEKVKNGVKYVNELPIYP
jgi:hypothetical protein